MPRLPLLLAASVLLPVLASAAPLDSGHLDTKGQQIVALPADAVRGGHLELGYSGDTKGQSVTIRQYKGTGTSRELEKIYRWTSAELKQIWVHLSIPNLQAKGDVEISFGKRESDPLAISWTRHPADRSKPANTKFYGDHSGGPVYRNFAEYERKTEKERAARLERRLADRRAGRTSSSRSASSPRSSSSLDTRLQESRRRVNEAVAEIDKTRRERLSKKLDGDALRKYGNDLTVRAVKGKLGKIVGREDVVEEIAHGLSRSRKNNIMLLGKAGVGKTSVAEALAQAIALGNVPPALRDAHVVELDVGKLRSGIKYIGTWEERMTALISDAKRHKGKLILFADEIHTLAGMGAAGESTTDVLDFLKPALQRGDIWLIGATTNDEFREHLSHDKAFMRRFSKVKVPEPSKKTTEEILKKAWKKRLEKKHGVTITAKNIKTAVKLADKFLPSRSFPDKAIDVLEDAAIKAAAARRKSITKKDLTGVISKASGVPVHKSGTVGSKDKSSKLARVLDKRVFSQSDAKRAVVGAVQRSEAGLNAQRGPLGSFLFKGPSGVGKTETTRGMAEALFGSSKKIIRLDMSDYSTPDSVHRLVGGTPGSDGYKKGGVLTNAVRDNPYSVVVFDELDHAHPDVRSLLLQILEEGEIKDSRGNTVSFENTYVVATSNDIKLRAFPSKLIGRFEEIVNFKGLKRRDRLRLAQRAIQRTAKILAKKHKIVVRTQSSALRQLARDGFDERYGARVLKHMVQKQIDNPLAAGLATKEFKKGDTVDISYRGGRYHLDRRRAKQSSRSKRSRTRTRGR